MFMERGETELALDQVKGKPELLKEIEYTSEEKEETPKKKKEK